jgi:hypothetical protein
LQKDHWRRFFPCFRLAGRTPGSLVHLSPKDNRRRVAPGSTSVSREETDQQAARRGADVEVPGFVSAPFGIFRGTTRGLGAPGSGEHTLTHLPTRRTGDGPERVLVSAPDQEKAQALLRLYEKVTRT